MCDDATRGSALEAGCDVSISSLELELEGTIRALVTKSARPRSPCRFSSDPELSLRAAYLRLRGVPCGARPGVENAETGGGTREVAGR